MFAVIYRFIVKENREVDFISAWKQLTQLIYEHEGSLGSRLHKQNDRIYLAYAQWPDKETWKSSGNKLPDFSGHVRTKMRESCTKIEVLYELDCTLDLLKSKTNDTKT